MRILKVEVTNFGSYGYLELELKDQGLILVHGATGSGKSTLQDIVPWLLFGVTAKGGKADDIRKWNSGELFGEAASVHGRLIAEIPTGVITITRIRGKSGQNDLYWNISGQRYRGKDITESQTLLEAHLGISSDLYIAGAYYNEFSPIGAFFTAKASARRELLEKLSDLSLPKTLYERAANERKGCNKAKLSISERLNQAIGRLQGLEAAEVENQRNAIRWSESQARSLEDLKEKSQNFDKEIQFRLEGLTAKSDGWIEETNSRMFWAGRTITKHKKTLQEMSDSCPTCGKDTGRDAILRAQNALQSELQQLKKATNPYSDQMVQIRNSVNSYQDELERQLKTTNPFVSNEHTIVRQRHTISSIKDEQQSLDNKISALEQLTSIAQTTRGLLLKTAVQNIQEQTNKYLETYFDAEIRVGFDIRDDDNLEVSIQKSGHECSYKQLSKGQRGLLKLCFSVSVMKAAANRAGIHFNALFFDEALDGLSSDLKLKAFNLFSELSKDHESVFVIDHDEALKTLFSKSMHVILENDESRIYD